nr:SLF2 protein [Citrus maxima]
MERNLTAMTGYGNLSDDLLIETLSRLPVKSLMRFRCVSKSWFSLVKDPNFIYKHLNRDDNMRLMVRVTYENYDVTDPFNDLITCFFLLPDKTLTGLHFQDLEAEMKDHNPLGPCDGIFCFFENSNINLWNVSMNEYRVVPKHKAHLPCDTSIYCRNFGLGLDPMTNDFKMVLILTLYDSKRLSVHDFLPVAVYSFSTNTWRDVESLFQMGHYYGSNSTDNVYLNGFCYWVAWGHNSYDASILSFSMSDEVFEEIKGPNVPQITAYDESEMASWGIGIYDGCLSLIYSEESGHSFSLWMRKGGFWTKHLTFGPFVETYQPLGFWRKGEFILESSNNRLVLYDSRYREIRDLGITGLWFSINILKESLITVREHNM